MEFITGVGGKPHVTSTQHRSIFESVIGSESYILRKGERLKPEAQSNNTIHIGSGMLCHHGGIAEVAPNTYDAVTISNGTQGMNRIDLIVARYSRDPESQLESMEWAVIQGEPSSNEAVVPDYTHGNMQDGDLIDECPVFAVHIKEIQVSEIETLLPVVKTGIYEEGKDSGWVTLTPDGNYEVVYGHRPQVRKRGNVVELSGGVRNTKNNIGGSTTEVRIGITLPEEYRPSKMVICPGYTNVDKVFQLHVNVDGTVTVSRAFSSDSGGYEAIQANTAIFFHAVYFVD